MSFPARVRPYALLCAAAVFLGALASYPVAEIGINDDWSYVRSAFAMAQTGHIVYMGWASAMLGWILPVGAVFVKLFGARFTAVRAAGVLIAAVNAFVLQRCFVRGGLRERNSAFAALTLILCPVYLPLATSFMTDLPGMLIVLLCFYSCLRAVRAGTDRACTGWLILAAVVSCLGGTARQTAWLGLLAMVPSATFLVRHRRLPFALLTAVWVACDVLIYLSMHWFRSQPYALGEALVGGYLDRDLLFSFLGHIVRATLEACLLLVPVTLVFLPHVRWGNRKVRRWVIFAAGAVLLLLVHSVRTHQYLASLAPFDGNYFTERGLVDLEEIGKRPVILGPVSRTLLTLLTLVCSVGCIGFCLALPPPRQDPAGAEEGRRLSWFELLVLTVPFSLAYVALLLHRALFEQAYDRYVLLLLFVPLLLLGRLYQDRVGARLPSVCLVAAAVAGVFTVMANHDLFAMERGRLRTTQMLEAAHISRDRFFAGWEYDGWTQVDRYGFVNSGWMQMPNGFTHQPPLPYPPGPSPCRYGWARVFPAIRPEYAVSFSPTSCAGPSGFAPVPYETWLPPFHGAFYVQRILPRKP